MAAYIICTSPRSGSTLLCRLLGATGAAGRPDSHFHRPSVAVWERAHGLPDGSGLPERERLARVIAAAKQAGSAGGDVFGLRLQRGSAEYLMQQLDRLNPGLASDIDRVEAAFGPTRFLHLSRTDKLAQAVSVIKAQQGGLWHRAPDGRAIEEQAPTGPLHYDAARIAAQIAEFEAFDRGWDDWFRAEGLKPLRIDYEALAADPGAVLRRVLGYLGLDPDAGRDVVPETSALADALSAEWIARFRAEHGPA